MHLLGYMDILENFIPSW